MADISGHLSCKIEAAIVAFTHGSTFEEALLELQMLCSVWFASASLFRILVVPLALFDAKHCVFFLQFLRFTINFFDHKLFHRLRKLWSVQNCFACWFSPKYCLFLWKMQAGWGDIMQGKNVHHQVSAQVWVPSVSIPNWMWTSSKWCRICNSPLTGKRTF